jgi:hypothetical protein
MSSSATSISILTGIDDAEIVARKAFLEFTEADDALWIVASGYLLTLAAQGWLARNSGFFLPLCSRPSWS